MHFQGFDAFGGPPLSGALRIPASLSRACSATRRISPSGPVPEGRPFGHRRSRIFLMATSRASRSTSISPGRASGIRVPQIGLDRLADAQLPEGRQHHRESFADGPGDHGPDRAHRCVRSLHAYSGTLVAGDRVTLWYQNLRVRLHPGPGDDRLLRPGHVVAGQSSLLALGDHRRGHVLLRRGRPRTARRVASNIAAQINASDPNCTATVGGTLQQRDHRSRSSGRGRSGRRFEFRWLGGRHAPRHVTPAIVSRTSRTRSTPRSGRSTAPVALGRRGLRQPDHRHRRARRGRQHGDVLRTARQQQHRCTSRLATCNYPEDRPTA